MGWSEDVDKLLADSIVAEGLPWRSCDPREVIGKHAEIIIITLDGVCGALVETKYGYDVGFFPDGLDADAKWPEGWVWTFRPETK